MENPNVCPFCGATSIRKNPYSDRLKKVELGGGAAEGSAHGAVELEPNPQKEEYYLCNGCNTKYVWANIDINLIIKHLKGDKDKISIQVDHYYRGQITLTDLLTKYRTGIVRKYSDQLSFISNKIVKRQLYICFNCNGIRSYATFMRKKNDTFHYIMVGIEVPKL